MTRWLAGGAAFLLIGFALWLGITRYGAARYAEGRATVAAEVNDARAQGELNAFQQYRAGIEQGLKASSDFLQWREGPLNTVRQEVTRETIRYAASPAGAAVCFDPDGLRDLNRSLAAIAGTAPAAAAGTGAGLVPQADRGGSAAGWFGEPGAGPRGARSPDAGAGRVRGDPPVAAQELAEVPSG